MYKYYFIYLVWLLPVYFLFQSFYQVSVYRGIINTNENGESYIATVTDFDVKQIAAQTNGYVVLQFSTMDGATVEEKLALPVQFAQVIMQSELIPVRYLEHSFRPIVMTPIVELQKNVVRVNIAVTLFGFLATGVLSLYASLFARKRIRYGEEKIEYEWDES